MDDFQRPLDTDGPIQRLDEIPPPKKNLCITASAALSVTWAHVLIRPPRNKSVEHEPAIVSGDCIWNNIKKHLRKDHLFNSDIFVASALCSYMCVGERVSSMMCLHVQEAQIAKCMRMNISLRQVRPQQCGGVASKVLLNITLELNWIICPF